MTTPAFSLDFTTAVLDPRVTFTRSGNTATRVNSSGLIEVVNADLPRFDFDPVTLACRGLLIEQAKSNLAPYSEDFNNWSKTNTTVVVDDAISPDGNQTADLVYPNTSSTALFGVRVWRNVFGLASSQYTCSFYIKYAGWRWVYILDPSGTNHGWFDLLNGVLGNTGGNTNTITDAGGGWYRCTVTRAVNTTFASLYVNFSNANGSTVCTASGTNGIHLWAGQLEAGNSATSYIPNIATGGTTRNADVAAITGTNFSSFWQATRGGVLVRALPSTVSGIRPLVQFDDATADNIIALRGNTTNPELYIVDGGAPQAQIDAGTIAANTAYSLTGWWQTNDCKARQNSGATVSDYTATIPTVTQARLGSDGTNYLNGHLATINYYDRFTGQIYDRRKNKAVFSLL
jgi:hypothetical protein